MNKRVEEILYKELVGLNILDGWLEADKYLIDQQKHSLQDRVWEGIEELEKIAERGVERSDVREIRNVAKNMINEYLKLVEAAKEAKEAAKEAKEAAKLIETCSGTKCDGYRGK